MVQNKACPMASIVKTYAKKTFIAQTVRCHFSRFSKLIEKSNHFRAFDNIVTINNNRFGMNQHNLAPLINQNNDDDMDIDFNDQTLPAADSVIEVDAIRRLFVQFSYYSKIDIT